jgi:hypothetical protein
MQQEFIQRAAADLPEFNDHLLKEFRRTKMDDIVLYLDAHFRNTVKLFDTLVYDGYRILSPMEAVKWRINDSNNRGKIMINRTTARVVNYRFTMEGVAYDMFISVPYMHTPENCVYLNDTRNYPIFLIMEQAIMAFRDSITVKAAIAVFKFYRNKEYTLLSTRGKAYHGFNITAKIHWGRKMKEFTPIVLYHLVEHGWYGTLKLYGLEPEDVNVVTDDDKQDGFVYFKLLGGKFLKVRETILLDNFRNVRFVIGIERALRFWRKYNVSDVYDSSATLFKIILGKMTNPGTSDPTQLLKYANNHLRPYSVMLDASTQYRFAKMGYPCQSMGDLLYHVFHNIDSWLIQQPRNLYNKKIGYLEPMLDKFIKYITTQQYYIAGHTNSPVRHEDVRKFVNKITSFNPKWFETICKSNPDRINNNWLLTIGMKMERKMSGNSAASRARSVPEEMLISHPSCLLVESPLCFPSSKPIMSGNINPFCEIDQDGDIVENAELSDMLADVYA